MKLTEINTDRPYRKLMEPVLPENKSNDLSGWREELDGYFLQMQEFGNMEPDEIFMTLSAYTSRVSYIRSQIMRSSSRILQAFRTGEVDPFINECDRQFKFWSRVQSVAQMDWNAQKNVT